MNKMTTLTHRSIVRDGVFGKAYQTAVPNIAVAPGRTRELTPSETLYTDSIDYLLGGALTLRNGRIDKYQFDEGYCQAETYTSTKDNFTFCYYDKDHLGNVRSVVTKSTFTNAVTEVQKTHYYPFGGIIADLSTGRSVQNRLYNGKDLDISNNLWWYDYGARQYDPTAPRFTSADPLAEKYYGWNMYGYCVNNPVRFIDLDGNRILFVNGYWSNIIGMLIGSSSSGKSYWGNGFSNAAQEYFNDYSLIGDNNYIDGSSMWGGDMSGSDRENAGYDYAKNNIQKLTDGMKNGEVFNIVTHSEGSAYGAGVARYLIEQGYEVKQVLHLSADEGDEFSTPNEPFTMQLSYNGDWVTNNKNIKNCDRIGIIDSSSLSWNEVHGTTKSKHIFKAAKDLRNAQIIQNIGMINGKFSTWYSVIAGTTSYGTIFTNINGQIIRYSK